MRRHVFAPVLLAACAAACGTSSDLPPALGGGDQGTPTHQNGAGSETMPPPTTTGYTVKVGGTVSVAPGTKVGYALTATAPKTYQFRWTGDAAVAGDGFREFFGSVWTTGHFTSLTPGCASSACPLETNDVVSSIQDVSGGQRIDWDTFASTGWDGFGFTTDAEPLYFDVYVDGNRHPDLFLFPRTPDGLASSPASSPFGISSSN